MDRLLKILQIINQIVWIVVGLFTIYSIYYFINHSGDLIKQLTPAITGNFMSQTSSRNDDQIPAALRNNPQIQKLLEQYSK